MSSYRIEVRPLESITRAIGYICIFWAWLEDTLDQFILDLSPLDDLRLTKNELEKIPHILASAGDIRDKIRVLRALAFLRKWEEPWFDKVNKILTDVDDRIRPLRNRFVHDRWLAPRGKLQYRTRTVRITKPQSFARVLVTEQHTPVRMKQIWDLGKSILNAQIKLIGLSIEHAEIQKLVDAEVKKRRTETFSRELAAGLAAWPAKSSPPNPQASPSKTHKGRPAAPSRKRKRQRGSSSG